MSAYRISVDLMLCQGHGVCTEECPEVFEVVDMETGYPKAKVKDASPGDALRSKVQDAVDYCPNRSIQLIEID